MIPWDGGAIHDDQADRCWRDVDGDECGKPAVTDVGLCRRCLGQMTTAIRQAAVKA